MYFVLLLNLLSRIAAEQRASRALKKSPAGSDIPPAIPNGLTEMSVEPDDTNNVLTRAFQSDLSAIADADIIEKISDGSANSSAIPLFGPLQDVTNDVSTAERTAVVPPARTPPRLKRKEPINTSTPHTDPTLVSAAPLLSAGDETRAVTPVEMMPDEEVNSVPAAPLASVVDSTGGVPTLAEVTSNSLTSASLVSAPILSVTDGTHAVSTPVEATPDQDAHVVPPVRPKPRPAYKSALEDRAKAESAKTAVNDPANKKPAKAAVTKKSAKSAAPASPAVVSVPVASSSTASDSGVAATDEEGQGSRRRRTRTAFGLLHAKEVEEKNEKLAQKRADRAKAAQKTTVKRNARAKK